MDKENLTLDEDVRAALEKRHENYCTRKKTCRARVRFELAKVDACDVVERGLMCQEAYIDGWNDAEDNFIQKIMEIAPFRTAFLEATKDSNVQTPQTDT